MLTSRKKGKMEESVNSKRIAVIGGGPAGLMAAGAAIDIIEEYQQIENISVFLFEKMDACGKKLLMTGNGRCNVTHAGAVSEYISKYFENGRFLYSALSAFSPDDLFTFFELQGVPLKVEVDGRIFPKSEKAIDILQALTSHAKEKGVRFMMEEAVLKISENTRVEDLESTIFESLDSVKGTDVPKYLIKTSKQTFCADKIIICTGGLSIPDTGSTGDGFRIAASLGHHVERHRPALCPIHIAADDTQNSLLGLEDLQGVSVADMGITLYEKDRLLKKERGSLLFTHFGVTGPGVFRISRELPIQDEIYMEGLVCLYLDFAPEQTQDQLVDVLFERLENSPNKHVTSALRGIWSESVLFFLLKNTALDPSTFSRNISKKQIRIFTEKVKRFPMQVKRKPDYKQAMVTRGGVKLSEISPKTMESKKFSGVFFAGEVLDVDGDTGGFNLQAAFSTGFVAGKNAGASICDMLS